jgi:hypothetical protein
LRESADIRVDNSEEKHREEVCERIPGSGVISRKNPECRENRECSLVARIEVKIEIQSD